MVSHEVQRNCLYNLSSEAFLHNECTRKFNPEATYCILQIIDKRWQKLLPWWLCNITLARNDVE